MRLKLLAKVIDDYHREQKEMGIVYGICVLVLLVILVFDFRSYKKNQNSGTNFKIRLTLFDKPLYLISSFWFIAPQQSGKGTLLQFEEIPKR